jgi:hypothetical protein
MSRSPEAAVRRARPNAVMLFSIEVSVPPPGAAKNMYIRPYDGRVNSDLWYPIRLRFNVSAPYMRCICICDAAGAIQVHRGARRLRVCGVPAARRGAGTYAMRLQFTLPADATAVRCNAVSAAYIRCRSSKQQTTVAARCQDHGSTARLTCGAVSKLTLSRETGHSSCGTSPESAQTAGGFAAEKRTSDTSLIIIHQKKDVCQYRRRRIFPFAEYGDVFRPRKRGRGEKQLSVS